MKLLVLGLCAFFIVPPFASSRADLAPPPGYVEQCTVKKQQGEGEHCVECRASFRDPDACSKRFEKTDYTHRCRTRGASAWGEVWCGKGETPPDPSLPKPAPEPAPEPEPEPAGPPAPEPAGPPAPEPDR